MFNIQETSKANLAFIVGAPRSGTTLLMSILNSHPEIHIVPEFKFFLCYLHKYTATNFQIKSNRVDIVKDFYNYINHKKKTEGIFEKIIDIDANKVNAFIDSNQIANYQDAVKLLYCSISIAKMQTPNPKVIIEKNPAYTQHIGKILELSPKTKYIGIIRDHRDAVSSRIASNERAIQNIQYYAKYWQLINQSLFEQTAQYKDNILLVFYDELIRQTEKTIAKCMEFLNLDNSFEYTTYQEYYQKLLGNLEKDTNLPNKDRWIKKFGDLSRPINSDAMGKWKDRLTAQQIEEVDALCLPVSKQYDSRILNGTAIKKENTFKRKSGYYKAVLNYSVDQYRFQLPPQFNIFLEQFVRKIGVI